MAEALILEFAGLTDADYRAVNAQPGHRHGDRQGGLAVGHALACRRPQRRGQLGGGRGVVVPGDQAAFMESRLGPALGAAGVAAVPTIRWVPLVAYHVPEA